MDQSQDTIKFAEFNTDDADTTGRIPQIVFDLVQSQESSEADGSTSVLPTSEEALDNSLRIYEASSDLKETLVSEAILPAPDSESRNGGLIYFKERDWACIPPCSLSVVLWTETECEESDSQSIEFSKGGSYKSIREAADNLVTTAFAHLPQPKYSTFLNGKCTMAGENTFPYDYPLDSENDWRNLLRALAKYGDSHLSGSSHLKVSFYYTCLEKTATEGQSFAKAVRWVIHDMMRESLKGEYISCTDVMRVICPDTVRRLVPLTPELRTWDSEQIQVLIEKILCEAPKLLAMCIKAELRITCFKELLDRGLSDASLPLNKNQACHRHCGPSFGHLLSSQGSFMAPKFKLGQNKPLPTCVKLPIQYWPRDHGIRASYQDGSNGSDDSFDSRSVEENIERSKAVCGHGAYSYVYRVRIHPDHHELDDDRYCDFAMKEFIKLQHAGAQFDKELKILDRLRELTHPHIVTHVASWRQGDDYCMLFPYADCNLREYITNHDFGPPDRENTLWLLSQLAGLASALKSIHVFSAAPATLSVLSAAQESAWHHDVKFDNILCFFRGNYPKRGSLKVADFGCGKVNILRSGSVNTRSSNGTLTYEAPEAIAEGVSSRPYDVWSLGCVFLELLTWAIEDSAAVAAFTQARIERRFPDLVARSIEDDSFFQIKKGDVPYLRKAVHEKIELLQGKSLKYDWQPFMEVIDLVKKMLDTDRHTRITASDLSVSLEKVWKQKASAFKEIADHALLEPLELKDKTTL
ncbi:hypothetical protein MMC30_007399 [Trapelia coarctata]|nr:hypothetical protein [Trapelia coarctata]